MIICWCKLKQNSSYSFCNITLTQNNQCSLRKFLSSSYLSYVYLLPEFSYDLLNLILKHVLQKIKPLFPFIPLFSVLFSISSSELSLQYLCINHKYSTSMIILNQGCIYVCVGQITNAMITPTCWDFCSNQELLRVYKLTSSWMKLNQLSTRTTL